ncbi:MAG TPA: YggT family protein [Pyrinomonadaceae bacterium]|jgi:YggT family protein|nr:YggT family protein [Pyrinomonadaceae bacterium]
MFSIIVYPIIRLILWSAFSLIALLLLARLLITLADPNPFGSIGRLGYKLNRITERWVYPAARFFSHYGINTRYAPLLTLFIAFLITYFALDVIEGTFYVIDGLIYGTAIGSISVIIGFIIYGLLSFLVLLIFLRFLSQWFVFNRRSFFGWVNRVTNPIMLPFQRIIPPIGMFDISPMILLLLIGLLQLLVMKIFIR